MRGYPEEQPQHLLALHDTIQSRLIEAVESIFVEVCGII